MRKTILLVDDDALMRRSLGFNLTQAGYNVISAESAEDGLSIVKRDPPDLILLDINLPGIDGLEALRALRKEFNIPVIFVTARRKELDQILGLELGADDYITKPFDFDVLNARVKAVFRRSFAAQPASKPPEKLVVGDFIIDTESHELTQSGKPVELSPREFDLFQTLAEHANKVVPSEKLLHLVWGPEFNGEPQVLYVHIRWLREKIEADPQNPIFIQTIRGIGYRLNVESKA